MSDTSVTSPGGSANYSVPFPYIARTHVKVLVNNVQQLTPSDYVWLNASTIQFRAVAHTTDDAITIKRETPVDDRLVVFQGGAVLSHADLNLSALQNFYIAQEAREYFQGLINEAFQRIATANGLIEIDPDLVIGEIVNEILSQEVADTIQNAITDIDTQGQNLLDLEAQLVDLEAVVDSLADIDGTGLSTFLENEQQARIDGDEALAETLALIGAVSSDQLAFVLDSTTVYIDDEEGDTLAQTLTALATADDTNSAAVVSEQTARISADGALAEDITALETTVGENSASVTSLASAVDGLEARYGVSLNVNDYITGFAQHNDGTTGTFDILADKFRIVDPANDGQNPKAVFTVEGGKVYMQDAFITNANIENLTIGGGKLVSEAASRLEFDEPFGSTNITTSWATYAEVTLDNTGYDTDGRMVILTSARFDNQATGVYKLEVRFLLTESDSTEIGFPISTYIIDPSVSEDLTYSDFTPFHFPSQDAWTFSLQARKTLLSGSSGNLKIVWPRIAAIEYKR